MTRHQPQIQFFNICTIDYLAMETKKIDKKWRFHQKEARFQSSPFPGSGDL